MKQLYSVVGCSVNALAIGAVSDVESMANPGSVNTSTCVLLAAGIKYTSL